MFLKWVSTEIFQNHLLLYPNLFRIRKFVLIFKFLCQILSEFCLTIIKPLKVDKFLEIFEIISATRRPLDKPLAFFKNPPNPWPCQRMINPLLPTYRMECEVNVHLRGRCWSLFASTSCMGTVRPRGGWPNQRSGRVSVFLGSEGRCFHQKCLNW